MLACLGRKEPALRCILSNHLTSQGLSGSGEFSYEYAFGYPARVGGGGGDTFVDAGKIEFGEPTQLAFCACSVAESSKCDFVSCLSTGIRLSDGRDGKQNRGRRDKENQGGLTWLHSNGYTTFAPLMSSASSVLRLPPGMPGPRLVHMETTGFPQAPPKRSFSDSPWPTSCTPLERKSNWLAAGASLP